MFGHGHPGAGHHKGRRRGNIEGPGAVTPGAAGIDQVGIVYLHPDHPVPHDLGAGGDLCDGLPFHP